MRIKLSLILALALLGVSVEGGSSIKKQLAQTTAAIDSE
jgi:hypothetical protein